MAAPWTGLEPVAWVLDEAPGVPPALVATLVCLARHARPDGTGAYPSISTLAACTRKSESQVRRDLRDLRETGLIRQGDEELTAHLRGDQRPTVYDLAMERKRGGVHDLPYTPPRRGAANEAAKKRKERKAGIPGSTPERPGVHAHDGLACTPERPGVHAHDGLACTPAEETLEEDLKKPFEEEAASLRSAGAQSENPITEEKPGGPAVTGELIDPDDPFARKPREFRRPATVTNHWLVSGTTETRHDPTAGRHFPQPCDGDPDTCCACNLPVRNKSFHLTRRAA